MIYRRRTQCSAQSPEYGGGGNFPAALSHRNKHNNYYLLNNNASSLDADTCILATKENIRCSYWHNEQMSTSDIICALAQRPINSPHARKFARPRSTRSASEMWNLERWRFALSRGAPCGADLEIFPISAIHPGRGGGMLNESTTRIHCVGYGLARTSGVCPKDMRCGIADSSPMALHTAMLYTLCSTYTYSYTRYDVTTLYFALILKVRPVLRLYGGANYILQGCRVDNCDRCQDPVRLTR